MRFSASTLALLLPALSLALSLPRAGGPARVPLPSNCTVASVCPAAATSAFSVATAFDSAGLVYSYGIGNGAAGPSNPDGSYDDADLVTECEQTCYGYGNGGDCVAVYTAHNVALTNHGFTSIYGFGCFLYAKPLAADVLLAVGPDPRSHDSAKALNIGCVRPGDD